MSELKPCPFCGGEARLVNCGSPMVVCLHGCCQIVDDKNSVEHWNTRPIEDELRAELASKDEQIEKLEDALHKISNWCKAYPLEIADEPTEDEWKTAHAIMNQHGWSLTTFVVSGMRRVTNGIAEIADLGE